MIDSLTIAPRRFGASHLSGNAPRLAGGATNGQLMAFPLFSKTPFKPRLGLAAGLGAAGKGKGSQRAIKSLILRPQPPARSAASLARFMAAAKRQHYE